MKLKNRLLTWDLMNTVSTKHSRWLVACTRIIATGVSFRTLALRRTKTELTANKNSASRGRQSVDAYRVLEAISIISKQATKTGSLISRVYDVVTIHCVTRLTPTQINTSHLTGNNISRYDKDLKVYMSLIFFLRIVFPMTCIFHSFEEKVQF